MPMLVVELEKVVLSSETLCTMESLLEVIASEAKEPWPLKTVVMMDSLLTEGVCWPVPETTTVVLGEIDSWGTWGEDTHWPLEVAVEATEGIVLLSIRLEMPLTVNWPESDMAVTVSKTVAVTVTIGVGIHWPTVEESSKVTVTVDCLVTVEMTVVPMSVVVVPWIESTVMTDAAALFVCKVVVKVIVMVSTGVTVSVSVVYIAAEEFTAESGLCVTV
jgi:hypothetical protein